jgi:hypothetical protein
MALSLRFSRSQTVLPFQIEMKGGERGEIKIQTTVSCSGEWGESKFMQ